MCLCLKLNIFYSICSFFIFLESASSEKSVMTFSLIIIIFQFLKTLHTVDLLNGGWASLQDGENVFQNRLHPVRRRT